MSDEQITVEPGVVIQVLNNKVNALTQANTLLEARLLQVEAEKEALQNQLIKNSEEDIPAESAE